MRRKPGSGLSVVRKPEPMARALRLTWLTRSYPAILTTFTVPLNFLNANAGLAQNRERVQRHSARHRAGQVHIPPRPQLRLLQRRLRPHLNDAPRWCHRPRLTAANLSIKTVSKFKIGTVFFFFAFRFYLSLSRLCRSPPLGYSAASLRLRIISIISAAAAGMLVPGP